MKERIKIELFYEDNSVYGFIDGQLFWSDTKEPSSKDISEEIKNLGLTQKDVELVERWKSNIYFNKNILTTSLTEIRENFTQGRVPIKH